MSDTKESHKSRDEMTPEEREVEHVRRLHEVVDAVKSGELKRGRKKERRNVADTDKTGP